MKNVAYFINKNYYPLALVSIKSLIESNNDINIYLVHNNLTPPHLQFIIELVKKSDSKLTIIKFNDYDKNLKARKGHLPTEAFMVLYAPIIFDSLEKILILDADTIILESLANLFEMNFEEPFAAALSSAMYNSNRFNIYNRLSLKNNSQLINSGVMYLNIPKIKTTRVFEKALQYASENAGIIKSADEDALNATHNNIVYIIPQEYNYQMQFQRLDIITSPKILHFNGRKKPYLHHFKKAYRNLFYCYLKQINYGLAVRVYLQKNLIHFFIKLRIKIKLLFQRPY